MPLTRTLEMLKKAQRGGYAVGAFNPYCLEMIQPIIEAAEEERAPVIIAPFPSIIKNVGRENIAALVKVIAQRVSIPVGLHLDHGNLKEIIRCFTVGFTSVMCDGSALPFEENVAFTRRAVEIAHVVGYSVEGEVGRVPGIEDEITVSELEARMTDPEQAREFVRLTGIDTLSVVVGNVHYMPKEPLKLDFDRLKKIREAVSVPLVMHGGAGFIDEDIKKAISYGICQYNVGYKPSKAFLETVHKAIEEMREEVAPGKLMVYPYKIMNQGKEAVKKDVKEKIQLFGSNGKA